jgi:hypothetical protein
MSKGTRWLKGVKVYSAAGLLVAAAQSFAAAPPPGGEALGPPAVDREAALREEVAALIGRLGDDDFAVREAASTRLGEMVLAEGTSKPVREALARARSYYKDPAHRNPEIVRRAGRALECYYSGVKPTDYPVMPWVDMLPAEYAGRQEVISRCLELSGGGGDGPGWPGYRAATAYHVRELLDRGTARKDIVALLDGMVKAERGYCQNSGLRAADGR